MNLRDPEAFRSAYLEHSGRVFASALRVLGDPGRAEDTTQEVFFRLWREPDAYHPGRGELGTYLCLMARSRAIDAWRSEQAGARAGDRLATLAWGDAGDAGDPAESAERHAQRSALAEALRALPAPQREALVLAYWGGLTIAEIARRSGVPLGTAKGRLRLGLDKLAAQPLVRAAAAA